MLTGMDKAWFKLYQIAQRDINHARNNRGSIFGIAINDDDLALQFQEAEYRLVRAEHALNGKWTPCALKVFRKRGLQARKEIKRRESTNK